MAIETLRPNAAGDETNVQYQVPSEGYHWDKVDEATPDESSTIIWENNTTYLRDLYNLPASSGAGTINSITVYARCNCNSPQQASLKIAIKSGQGTNPPDTVSESSEITVTTSYANYSQAWNTNPKTGAAWTWDEIDNLQIGIALRRSSPTGHTMRCTQVYVEVDYAAVTAKTSSDTGSGADAYVSLVMLEAKSSSDTGSGVEGTPLPSASLSGSETGSGIEVLVARLLVAVDTGTGIEVAQLVGLLKELFATDWGEGLDLLVARIEMPTKGGGMKLWT